MNHRVKVGDTAPFILDFTEIITDSKSGFKWVRHIFLLRKISREYCSMPLCLWELLQKKISEIISLRSLCGELMGITEKIRPIESWLSLNWILNVTLIIKAWPKPLKRIVIYWFQVIWLLCNFISLFCKNK